MSDYLKEGVGMTLDEPTKTLPDPAAEEVDLWWGGPDIRRLIPVILRTIGLNGGLIVAAWVYWCTGLMPAGMIRSVIHILSGLLWAYQLSRWLYLSAAISFRLTTRRLYGERGFFPARHAVIDLERIASVGVEQHGLDRWLGLGWIRLELREEPTEPLFMRGIYHPEQVATLIRETVQRRTHKQH